MKALCLVGYMTQRHSALFSQIVMVIKRTTPCYTSGASLTRTPLENTDV